MMNLVESNLWDNVLQSIKTKLQRESFETWFNPIRFEGIDKARCLIRLRAPNEVVQDWVNENYASLISESFCELSLDGYAVDWILPADFAASAMPTVSVDEVSPTTPEIAPLEAASVVARSAVDSPAATAAAPARAVAFDPALNSKYTFDSFVVGSCNQFAHAASHAVAEAPGKTYNPLFLWRRGLGKTH